jgi:hypothetical protein
VYMSPVQSSAILEWFSRYFSQVDKAPLGSIVYEMFGLDDAFGRVMVSNLKVHLCQQQRLECGMTDYTDKKCLSTRGSTLSDGGLTFE